MNPRSLLILLALLLLSTARAVPMQDKEEPKKADSTQAEAADALESQQAEPKATNRSGADYVFTMQTNGAFRWLPGQGPDESLQETRLEGDSLYFKANFPDSLLLRRRLLPEEASALGRADFFCVSIYVPGNSRPQQPISVRLRADHPDWGLFVSEPTVPLERGKWTEISWPLDEKNEGWTSVDSPGLIWNNVMRRRLDSISLEFFSNDQSQPELRISDACARKAYAPEAPLDLRFVEYPDQQPAPVGQVFEMRFDITRAYDNPYDPEQIAIDVEYQTPSGRRMSLPAFYYQDYVRMELSNEAEKCQPIGRAHWRARFTPLEPGTHTFTIQGKDAEGKRLHSEPYTFEVQKARFKGMVEIDPDDSHYLRYADGSFFYPIGLIVRSPYDTRTKYHYEFEPKPDRGLNVYDEVFPQMRKSGINFTRVWMSSWWMALEWSEGIRPDYAGLGRYSQLSAWRLDYVMELARQNDLWVALTLQNHGQFSLRVDPEWVDNPYNILNGGYVRNPQDFWGDERCRESIRKRLRYIVARWAPHPNLVWYEMSNELDLVNEYERSKEAIFDWHRKMARHIRSLDPYKHMITTHYVGGRFDPSMFHNEEMEIVQSNGYSQNMVKEVPRLFHRFRYEAARNKPAIINEYGEGTRIDTHLSNFHSGLWASGVHPFCGPAMFWYFQYVQGTDRWNHYRAFEKYVRGEDFRGRNYEPARMRAQPGELQGVGMGNDHSMRIWVSDTRFYPMSLNENQIPSVLPEPLIENGSTDIFGLKAGKYRVEYWDTWGKGGMREGATQEIQYNGQGALKIKIPAFRRDIACKIEKID